MHGEILDGTAGYAFFGVNIFFVLSGFLITGLLVSEWDKYYDISFRRFYCRRALRLLPALILMMLVFVPLEFFIHPRGRAIHQLEQAFQVLLYCVNWVAMFWGKKYYFTHAWSLSIEEQFYFLWPPILLFMLRRSTRSSILCWIFLAAVLSLVTRIAVFVGGTQNLSGNIFPVDPARICWGTDTRADSLLLGCFTGVLVFSNLVPKCLQNPRVLTTLAVASIAGLYLLARGYLFSASMVCAGWFLCSVLAAIIILQLTTCSNTIIHVIFGFRPLVFIGQISYGLYLWHGPILCCLRDHNLPWRHLAFLVITIPVVLLSYYFVERPFLTFKKQFERAPNSATRDNVANEVTPGMALVK